MHLRTSGVYGYNGSADISSTISFRWQNLQSCISAKMSTSIDLFEMEWLVPYPCNYGVRWNEVSEIHSNEDVPNVYRYDKYDQCQWRQLNIFCCNSLLQLMVAIDCYNLLLQSIVAINDCDFE